MLRGLQEALQGQIGWWEALKAERRMTGDAKNMVVGLLYTARRSGWLPHAQQLQAVPGFSRDDLV
jgi:hypothetical protein